MTQATMPTVPTSQYEVVRWTVEGRIHIGVVKRQELHEHHRKEIHVLENGETPVVCQKADLTVIPERQITDTHFELLEKARRWNLPTN